MDSYLLGADKIYKCKSVQPYLHLLDDEKTIGAHMGWMGPVGTWLTKYIGIPVDGVCFLLVLIDWI
jgi:hypothetical protein